MPVRILVVEDDFANQRVASLFLKKLGYEVDIGENGEKGLALALQNPYQLIFMDCQMPVMDGFQTARLIREKSGPNQTIPIIALTANVVAGINDDCSAAGMNDVLSKPVLLSNMQQMLDKWLVTAE